MAVLAAVAAAAWTYLITARGSFWRALPRLSSGDHRNLPLSGLPSVVTVVPARNESSVIEISLRSLESLRDIWEMVARSAYAQLNYSPLLLAASVFGLAIIYAGPPSAVLNGAVNGNVGTALFGSLAWLMMAAAYRPTLRLYGVSSGTAIFLPVISLLYCAMTLDSALRHYRGRGGGWKGRIYSGRSGSGPSGSGQSASGQSDACRSGNR